MFSTSYSKFRSTEIIVATNTMWLACDNNSFRHNFKHEGQPRPYNKNLRQLDTEKKASAQ